MRLYERIVDVPICSLSLAWQTVKSDRILRVLILITTLKNNINIYFLLLLGFFYLYANLYVFIENTNLKHRVK